MALVENCLIWHEWYLVPVMRVPPDFLDVEFNPAAEIYGLVFLIHPEALVVRKGLKRRAVVADVHNPSWDYFFFAPTVAAARLARS
jgi:hypothetical protein